MPYDVDKRPAQWLRTRARSHERSLLAVVGLAAALMIAALVAGFVLQSILLTLPLVAIMFWLSRHFQRREQDARRWAEGTRAESAVGETLNALRGHGYIVMHDIEQSYEGNVDHFVSGPTGVYMIETKARRYRDADLRKARRQATKLGRELGVWVTAVISIHERENPRVFEHRRVWIVPRELLLEWIQRQQNQTLPFERLARFADGLSPRG